MERHPWSEPVKVGPVAVTGPEEALDFLDHRCRASRVPRFVQAHHTCLAAHDGRCCSGRGESPLRRSLGRGADPLNATRIIQLPGCDHHLALRQLDPGRVLPEHDPAGEAGTTLLAGR